MVITHKTDLSRQVYINQELLLFSYKVVCTYICIRFKLKSSCHSYYVCNRGKEIFPNNLRENFARDLLKNIAGESSCRTIRLFATNGDNNRIVCA